MLELDIRPLSDGTWTMTMETEPTMPHRDQSVVGVLLERWAKQRPDSIFLLFEDDSSWTFAQTLKYTGRAAAGLNDLGVNYGSHVLCWLSNSKETILSWFGANYLGATFVPVNTAYRSRLLEHVIALSDAKDLVARADLLSRLDEFDYEIPNGQFGELVLQTDRPWEISIGCYKNPVATAVTWRNGWFHRGDAFRCDDEDYEARIAKTRCYPGYVGQ